MIEQQELKWLIIFGLHETAEIKAKLQNPKLYEIVLSFHPDKLEYLAVLYVTMDERTMKIQKEQNVYTDA